MGCQRAAAVRGREAGSIAATAPIGCLAGSGRCGQLVRKTGGQRLFHAVADCQAVENRCVVASVRAFKKIAERIDLGLQPCRMRGGLALCRHGGVESRLAVRKRCFGGGKRRCRLFRIDLGAGQGCCRFACSRFQLVKRDAGKVLFGRSNAAFQIGGAVGQRLARACRGANLSGGIGKGSVGGICLLARAGKGGDGSLPLRRRLINLLLELSRLGLQPFHRVGRIAAKAFLARDVFAHLRLPRDHALYGIANPRLFAVELVTTDGKALKFRGAGDLCFPQFRQGGSLFGTCGGTGCCGLGAFRGERACGAKGIVAFGK